MRLAPAVNLEVATVDLVFSAQFSALQGAFLRRGISIEIAYTRAGEAAYLYQVGRLLATREIAPEVLRLLPGAFEVGQQDYEVGQQEQPTHPSLVVLNIEQLSDGYRTVPDALDFLDEHLATKDRSPVPGSSAVTPVHVMHICNGVSPDTVSGRLCPYGEPEPPTPRSGSQPYPPVDARADDGAGVLIGLCDTGLLPNRPAAPWLTGANGATDPLGPPLPGGLDAIPLYCGHGTFAAGVARCEAPAAGIYVSNPFMHGGGLLETTVVAALDQMISRHPAPKIINLSAGGNTRNGFSPLSFAPVKERLGDIVLVAAAGNDSSATPFYPAALDWVVAVGALGSDLTNLASFTNDGPWVDVYAPGEGLVNAFATGVYTYQEPPKRPAQAVFHGRALWQGTSFAAPLVAGRIAAEMTRSGVSASQAWANLLAYAKAHPTAAGVTALLPD
jgi:hypothetical protein